MSWRDRLPRPRGRLLFDEPLAPFTWLRVGGPADVLFLPADPQDLSDFLDQLPDEVPRTILGVGSNLIVRDGGIEGVVIRLTGREFAAIHIDAENSRVIAGSAALDSAVARAAAKAGIAGLEFYAGIPGTVGGALTMNAGCYGRETKDVLIGASADDFTGELRMFELQDLGYSYRHSNAPPGIIWTRAIFQGRPDDPAAIAARMDEITARREASQPIREKTGGSTFKNPPGDSAWRLVDAAGWRGKPYGAAQFSDQHANFLINTGEAAAADLEGLGEVVRAEVAAKFGVELEWEIKRIGREV
ncbi:MAG TPA: UDP-N-acetylmuramate dehydrogenase [Caulobacteraceae bacterium]|jgi:UDP-N-acetylmuramate dehydrogenase|nr:UDP-N-acetylmuramate dehydrogenase [Caulobacteraceae bacterium]